MRWPSKLCHSREIGCSRSEPHASSQQASSPRAAGVAAHLGRWQRFEGANDSRHMRVGRFKGLKESLFTSGTARAVLFMLYHVLHIVCHMPGPLHLRHDRCKVLLCVQCDH
jgi:hypothetical protein